MAADKMDTRSKIKQIDIELLALVKARGELVKQVVASDWQVAKKVDITRLAREKGICSALLDKLNSAMLAGFTELETQMITENIKR